MDSAFAIISGTLMWVGAGLLAVSVSSALPRAISERAMDTSLILLSAPPAALFCFLVVRLALGVVGL